MKEFGNKFTLIAPCYNEGEFVHSFIDRIGQQTLKPAEIIIVDGSDDIQTVELLDAYQAKISTLKVYRSKFASRAFSRGPVGFARNFAILNAKHDLLMFTDFGCFQKSDWCENMIKFLESNNLDCVFGTYDFVTRNDFMVMYKELYLPKMGFASDKFLGSSRSMLLTKDTICKAGLYPTNSLTAEDTVFASNLRSHPDVNIGVLLKNGVEWECPSSFNAAIKKHYMYGYGDGYNRLFVLRLFLSMVKTIALGDFWLKRRPLKASYLKWRLNLANNAGHIMGLIDSFRRKV